MKDAPPAPTSVLASSARGTTYLIVVQVFSRALTFVVNQILLRFLSPELLGIANQLDLYAVSVLYFSRESLRVALQRSGNDGSIGGRGSAEQAAANLSYVAVAIGVPLSALLAWLYLRSADEAVLAVPTWRDALLVYAMACSLELFSEPAFAVGQRQMLFGLRAQAETVATLLRCLLTCCFAIRGSQLGLQLGALPFAWGQMGFALALNGVYYLTLWDHDSSFSLGPRPLHVE